MNRKRKNSGCGDSNGVDGVAGGNSLGKRAVQKKLIKKTKLVADSSIGEANFDGITELRIPLNTKTKKKVNVKKGQGRPPVSGPADIDTKTIAPANTETIPPELTKKKKKKKKSKVGEVTQIPAKKISKKKLEMRQKFEEKKKVAVSKTKLKNKARIASRKEQSETAEFLYAELQNSMDPKATHKDVLFPKKLRANSGDQMKGFNESEKPTQQHFFETDSEGSGEDENAEEEMKKFFDKVNERAENRAIKMEAKNMAKKQLQTPDSEDEMDVAEAKEDLSPIKGANVVVQRTEAIQNQRSNLPIFAEEQEIVEAINQNKVTILCGETGSGKTTQVPQFLYESGYTSQGHMIGITEPRRVAAMSMAARVGAELNDPHLSSYQIRFEGNKNPKTKLLFMTDGVLMREIKHDIMLSKFSVIVIDEAHERSMYTDVLIGILSRMVIVRSKRGFPLKLIIMSATLRLDDFLQKHLFPTIVPKVIKVESRQFPVTVHFEKNTPQNYIDGAVGKVAEVHEKLPKGAILVFVSGQIEVQQIIKKLIARYPVNKNPQKKKGGKKGNSKTNSAALEEKQEEKFEDLDEFGTADAACIDEDLDDGAEENMFLNAETLPPPPKESQALYCLPLYSLLPTAKQQRIFETIPEGTRLCIISTNVAETSITIPNVKYVIDSGKEKRKEYDSVTGVSRFVVSWCSQASANQRSGRAGRVQAGHTYRLYSSAVFQGFEKFTLPEILNKPTDQLVLQLKAMNIIKVSNFPFVTKPRQDQLEASEQRLVNMLALNVSLVDQQKMARVTSLGRTLAALPLSPGYGRMIVMANQKDLFNYALTMAAVLSVREPLISLSSIKGADERLKLCGYGQSRLLGDISLLLKLIGAALYENWDKAKCEKNGLRYKAFVEVRKMRKQLIIFINSNKEENQLEDELSGIDDQLEPPTELQAKQLRQILTCCLPEQIAKKVEDGDVTNGTETPRGAYWCQRLEDYVFIDPVSILFKVEPEYVMYQEIIKVQDKHLMRGLTAIDKETISVLCASSCSFEPIQSQTSSLIKEKEKIYKFDDKLGTVVQQNKCFFSPRQWSLGAVDRPLPINIKLYKHFAYHFLEGNVIKGLAPYKSTLLAPPSSLLQDWSKLQLRNETLLNKFIEREIHTRAALIAIWNKGEKEFLLDEYLLWLPQSSHDIVTLEWPPQ
uniref:ATP-dependent RNA helicase kurz n=1 Tax=Rhabditophanes sp. KR3021 TaxID=114890 RepID=A0AC35UEY3_9BILA